MAAPTGGNKRCTPQAAAAMERAASKPSRLQIPLRGGAIERGRGSPIPSIESSDANASALIRLSFCAAKQSVYLHSLPQRVHRVELILVAGLHGRIQNQPARKNQKSILLPAELGANRIGGIGMVVVTDAVKSRRTGRVEGGAVVHAQNEIARPHLPFQIIERPINGR